MEFLEKIEAKAMGFSLTLFSLICFLKAAAELRQRDGAINEGTERTSGLKRE
jgi:hypothetical protein